MKKLLIILYLSLSIYNAKSQNIYKSLALNVFDFNMVFPGSKIVNGIPTPRPGIYIKCNLSKVLILEFDSLTYLKWCKVLDDNLINRQAIILLYDITNKNAPISHKSFLKVTLLKTN